MATTPEQTRVLGWVLAPILLIWNVNGIYLSTLGAISIPLFWLADVAQWIVLPATLLWVLARNARLNFHDIGLDLRSLQWSSAIFGSLAIFATTGIFLVVARDMAWHILGRPTGFFFLPNVFPEGWLGTLSWVYASATAGFVESIFFIAVPWLWYASVRGPETRIAFIVLISLIFGVAHWEQGPHLIVGAFTSHLIACLWYFRLRTLWPVAIGHMMVDLAAFY